MSALEHSQVLKGFVVNDGLWLRFQPVNATSNL